jgi:hypothetical protein
MEINRRQFIQSTLVVVAGLTIPTVFLSKSTKKPPTIKD